MMYTVIYERSDISFMSASSNKLTVSVFHTVDCVFVERSNCLWIRYCISVAVTADNKIFMSES